MGELTFVNPRTVDGEVLRQTAVRVSKGALQHSLADGGLRWRACDSIHDAVAGAAWVVAITRLDDPDPADPAAAATTTAPGALWRPPPAAAPPLVAAAAAPAGLEVLQTVGALAERVSAVAGSGGDGGTVALVFGREDAGFLPCELAAAQARRLMHARTRTFAHAY